MKYIGVIVLLALCTAESLASFYYRSGRVQLEDNAADNFAMIGRFIDDSGFSEDILDSWSAEDMFVYSIEEDQRNPGNLMAAVSHALYTINVDGTSDIVAGYYDAGNSNGQATLGARFNETAGFVQLNRDIVLISDRNNHCVRKLSRNTGRVTTYAGACNPNANPYGRSRYIPWKTFNSPSRIMNIKNKLHLLDTIDGKSVIVSKDLTTEETSIKVEVGSSINDFAYDPVSSSFAVTDKAGVFNITAGGGNYQLSFIDAALPYGLAISDGIMLVTDKSKSIIKVVDINEGKMLFSLCDVADATDYQKPFCSLTNPTAVAMIGGYMYFSNSPYPTNEYRKSYIYRIPYSIVNPEEEDHTDSVFDSGYKYGGDEAASAGSTVTIALLVTLAVIVKIGLIVLCVWRWSVRVSNRRRFYRQSTTVVAVAPPITTVHQSTVPYSELQNYSPAVQPPAYSQH